MRDILSILGFEKNYQKEFLKNHEIKDCSNLREIKVGLIFKNKRGKEVFVVTKIDDEGGDRYSRQCNTINTNGETAWRYVSTLEKCYTIIGDYPTWMAAVNSKEFRR